MTRFLRATLCLGVWLCGLALLTELPIGYAQTPSSAEQLIGRQGDLEKFFSAKSLTPPSTGGTFFEGAVDADKYIVGPGDRFNVVFWKPTYTEYPALVNGDGDVVIPYVGLVHVAGLTLRKARTDIEDTVTRTLRFGQVTVSLTEPRRFRVHVAGQVTHPGTYVVSATDRIADAILLAGGLKRERVFVAGDTSSIPKASERRIELLSADGHVMGNADLLLFDCSGNTNMNPYVLDGQVIRVPYPKDGASQIGVFGEVNSGGLFESTDHDCVGDLIALGGGLTSRADSSASRVIGTDGLEMPLDLRQISAWSQPIGTGDRLYIGGKPDVRQAGSVTIKGEITRPGGYPIVPGQTTVSEVLEAAGGLLPTAAGNSARLIRKTADLAAPERERVLMAALLRPTTQPTYKVEPDLAAQLSRWDYGTVVLDLRESAKSGDASKVTFMDGDVLEIPAMPLGVRVIGAVNNAGEVAWSPDGNLSHYIKEAGGINRTAWKGQTRVIKARNGSMIRYQQNLPIDPGDVVFIPAKPERTSWDLIKDFVAVTSQVATVALILQNIGK